jgi:hypothetical protein
MAEKVKRGWLLPTGLFIRNYLLRHKTAYSQEIWRALKEERAKANIYCGSYQSFRMNYIYVLKRLGLIRPVRKEKAKHPKWFDRVYYEITPGKEMDPRWAHPQIAFNPIRGGSPYRRGYERAARKRRVAVEARPITREELDRIWVGAEAFLREKGYRITRDVMDSVVPEWTSEVALYSTFKERVGYTIRKAAETEYVSRIARRWIRLEEAPEPIRDEAIRVGRTLEREWLRTSS